MVVISVMVGSTYSVLECLNRMPANCQFGFATLVHVCMFTWWVLLTLIGEKKEDTANKEDTHQEVLTESVVRIYVYILLSAYYLQVVQSSTTDGALLTSATSIDSNTSSSTPFSSLTFIFNKEEADRYLSCNTENFTLIVFRFVYEFAVGPEIKAAMVREERALPVKVAVSVPLSYHKAAFGFVTHEIRSMGDAQSTLLQWHKKEFEKKSKAIVVPPTRITHEAGKTIIYLYYKVYNAAGSLCWPLNKL